MESNLGYYFYIYHFWYFYKTNSEKEGPLENLSELYVKSWKSDITTPFQRHRQTEQFKKQAASICNN